MKIVIEAESIEELLSVLRKLEEDHLASEKQKQRKEIAGGKSIRNLGLTVRTTHCLLSEGIETVEQLLTWSRSDLLRIPNMGKKSVDEIMVILAGSGMQLADVLGAKLLHTEVAA